MTLTPQLDNADAIRDSAQQVLARPEYQLDPPLPGSSKLLEYFWMFLEWLVRPLRWLFDSMEGLPEPLRWLIVVLLLVLLVALVGHLIYVLLTAVKPAARKRGFATADAAVLTTAEDFERLAQEAASRRDYINAVRCLFRAALLRLQDREQRRFRPGMTNREVLSRYRNAPFIEAVRQLVDTIDAGWYGGQLCQEPDYRRCHDAYRQISEEATTTTS